MQCVFIFDPSRRDTISVCEADDFIQHQLDFIRRRRISSDRRSDLIGAAAFYGSSLSVSEIKKLLGLYFKHLAELEDNVERYADVAKLYGAYVAAVNIRKLGKLHLRQLFPFAVVHDIEAELFI